MPRTFCLKSIALLLLGGLILLPACSQKGGAGGIAPDFSLQDTSGNTVSIKDFKGKCVIIDFWATWCPPCLMSIPELAELHKKYRDKGLVVLGISLDDPGKVDNQALNVFKSRHQIDYTILRGTDKVALEYIKSEQMAIPTMFFVDKDGRIVEKLVGFVPGRVETVLKKLLG